MERKTMNMLELPRLSEIGNAFFRGMQDGYVAGAKGVSVRSMPGYRLVATKFGDWKVTDMWAAKTYGFFSAGSTTVFHCNIPVWTMSYEGWYSPKATAFLRKALSNAYSQREFCGGRGCQKYHEPSGGMEYSNVFYGNFIKFDGTETIIHTGPHKEMGRHTYRGGILF